MTIATHSAVGRGPGLYGRRQSLVNRGSARAAQVRPTDGQSLFLRHRGGVYRTGWSRGLFCRQFSDPRGWWIGFSSS